DGAIEHYERVVTLPIPDKLPLPLQVHRKAGEPCPRCGTTIEQVHYEDYVMCYCPAEQTQGKVLKDRRLSPLLKYPTAGAGSVAHPVQRGGELDVGRLLAEARAHLRPARPRRRGQQPLQQRRGAVAAL